MPATDQINAAQKGMVMDLHPNQIGEGGYTYALNAEIESFDGNGFPVIQNTLSNLLVSALSFGYNVLHFINIWEDNRVILFLYDKVSRKTSIYQLTNVYDCFKNNALTKDEGPQCDTCTGVQTKLVAPLENMNQFPCGKLELLLSSDCFTWDVDTKLSTDYNLSDCELEIFIGDGVSDRSYLKFDRKLVGDTYVITFADAQKRIIGYKDAECKQPIYANELDCNKFRVAPNINKPCVEILDVVNGGNLTSGSYQFFVALADEEGTEYTTYYGVTNIVPIRTKDIAVDTNYKTDRAIKVRVNIEETDSPYEYYNLAVAKTVSGFTTYDLVGTFPITTHECVYTGFGTPIPLDEGRILANYPFYKSATGVKKINNFLFWYNLKEHNYANWQRVANNISLKWATIAIDEDSYKKGVTTNKFRSALRDEVYAIGIVFEFDNGDETCALHIPGREMILSDVDIIANNDVFTEEFECDDITRNKRWQVYNTASVTETPHNYSNGCDGLPWEVGEFAYWESSEKYPNDPDIWGDLCGKPIRHHKFPDSCVSHIHDSLNGAKTYKDDNRIFPLGVKVDVDNVKSAISKAVLDKLITAEDATRITGFRIVRGNRFGNKSIQAKGLIYDVWSYNKNNKKYYFPNHGYNDLRPDPFLSGSKGTYNVSNSQPAQHALIYTPEKRYTFHSPDIHFTQAGIGSELKIESEEYGESENQFVKSECEAKQKFMAEGAFLLAVAAGIALGIAEVQTKECYTYTKKGTITKGSVDAGVETHNPILTGSLFYRDPTIGILNPLNPAGLTFHEMSQHFCTGQPMQMINLLSLTGVGFGAKAFYTAVKVIDEIRKFVDLIKAFLPLRNFHYQVASVGKYNNYTCPVIGQRRRKLNSHAYLNSQIQQISEKNVAGNNELINFNNWKRETSVYLRHDGTAIAPTTHVDTSKVTVGGSGGCNNANQVFYRPISSYYASIKNYVPGQYGSIYGIEYLETESCSYGINSTDTNRITFGFDTFINRFGLKRKMPFFLFTTCKQDDESDIKYQDLGNVAYPTYYFNSPESLGETLASAPNFSTFFDFNNIPLLFGAAKKRFDCNKKKFFYEDGFIYTYNYSVPYFLVESDVNVDYRHASNNLEGDYYPRRGDIGEWTQEDLVPIVEDNVYNYNTDFSKQIKESFICNYKAGYDPNKVCITSHENRVIYSDQGSYFKYRANNYYDFPVADGKLVSIESIENEKALVRLTNTIKVFNAFITLQSSADSVYVGSNGIFAQKPIEFAKTFLGYAGTQHETIKHTEFGHIWADAKRGQVFNLLPNASNLEEISKDGVRNWFMENLPFKIKRYIPNIPDTELDNAYKGLGLSMGYDKRYKRFFLTKHDYIPLNPKIVWNESLKELQLNGQTVNIRNKNLFCDASWTISYSFFTKTWVSFHSFKPNYYIEGIDYFLTGINNNSNTNGVSSIWIHNAQQKSFQVYYGVLYPFVIETVAKSELFERQYNSASYNCEMRVYRNNYNWSRDDTKIPFNKAIIYTDNQCSGLLQFEKHNRNDLSLVGIYPKKQKDKWICEISNSEDDWRFNQFYDLTRSNLSNTPMFTNTCSNADKELNQLSVNYFVNELDRPRIRNNWSKLRLINDDKSQYKMLYHWVINKSIRSIR